MRDYDNFYTYKFLMESNLADAEGNPIEDTKNQFMGLFAQAKEELNQDQGTTQTQSGGGGGEPIANNNASDTQSPENSSTPPSGGTTTTTTTTTSSNQQNQGEHPITTAVGAIGNIYQQIMDNRGIKNARLHAGLEPYVRAALADPTAPIHSKVLGYLTQGELTKLKRARANWEIRFPGITPPWYGDALTPAQDEPETENPSSTTNQGQATATQTQQGVNGGFIPQAGANDIYKLDHGHFTPEAIEYFKRAGWTDKEIKDLRVHLLKQEEEKALKRKKDKEAFDQLKFDTTLGNGRNISKIVQNLNARLKQMNPSSTGKFMASGNFIVDPYGNKVLNINKVDGAVGLTPNNEIVYEYTNQKGKTRRKLGTSLASIFNGQATAAVQTTAPTQNQPQPAPQPAPQTGTQTGSVATTTNKPTYKKKAQLIKADTEFYTNLRDYNDNSGNKILSYPGKDGLMVQYQVQANDLISDDGTEAVIHPQGSPRQGIRVKLDPNEETVLGSESSVLTYKQFTNKYREVVEKHSSEVSPRNMYQLYLLGKVKKLIK